MMKEATIHFFLIDKSHFANICTLSLCDNIIHRNWLCKHRKKVRSSQACISINSCTELSKTKFSLWVLLSWSKCSLEPKNFLRGLCPLNPLLRDSDPPALLMLAILHFPQLKFPAGFYDIHLGYNKMRLICSAKKVINGIPQ